MKIIKIRRVGNSNVISLPRELEGLGYTAGTEVMIEELDAGELRIVPTSRVQQLIHETTKRVVAENREALALLADQDGPVTADTSTGDA